MTKFVYLFTLLTVSPLAYASADSKASLRGIQNNQEPSISRSVSKYHVGKFEFDFATNQSIHNFGNLGSSVSQQSRGHDQIPALHDSMVSNYVTQQLKMDSSQYQIPQSLFDKQFLATHNRHPHPLYQASLSLISTLVLQANSPPSTK